MVKIQKVGVELADCFYMCQESTNSFSAKTFMSKVSKSPVGARICKESVGSLKFLFYKSKILVQVGKN